MTGADRPADPPPGRLCYAPPGRIPHPPHVWHWPVETGPGEPIRTEAWYCDGWAALIPAIVRSIPR